MSFHLQALNSKKKNSLYTSSRSKNVEIRILQLIIINFAKIWKIVQKLFLCKKKVIQKIKESANNQEF